MRSCAAPESMSWYYAENSQRHGPIDDPGEWEALVNNGTIKPQTLVWREGMEKWAPYSTVSAVPPLPGTAATGELASVETVSEEAGIAPVELVYAGFWIRLCAKLIDGLILQIVLRGLAIALQLNVSENTQFSIFVGGLIGATYNILFNGKFGATPGKMVFRIRIVTADGSPLGFPRAVARYFAEFLSAVIFLIGYVMVAFDSHKRALHDMICDTRVIHAG
jgi:uncharacterized RDD family membrane protein YckC